MRAATPEEIRKLQERIQSTAVSHAEIVAPIHERQGIVVLVIDPAADMKDGLTAVGWDGRSEAFEMSTEAAERMAHNCQAMFFDDVTAQWLRSSRPGRFFVWYQRGTLLVNFDGRQWSIEPGSTNRGEA